MPETFERGDRVVFNATEDYYLGNLHAIGEFYGTVVEPGVLVEFDNFYDGHDGGIGDGSTSRWWIDTNSLSHVSDHCDLTAIKITFDSLRGANEDS